MKKILPLVMTSLVGFSSLYSQPYGNYNDESYYPSENRYQQGGRNYNYGNSYNPYAQSNSYRGQQPYYGSGGDYYQPNTNSNRNSQGQTLYVGYFDPKTGDLETPETARQQQQNQGQGQGQGQQQQQGFQSRQQQSQQQQPQQSQPIQRQPVQQAPATRINWTNDYSDAVSQARAQNKPIVILFTGTTWCPTCIKLENEVLGRPDFARAVGNNFVFLKAEFNDYSEDGMRNSPYRGLMERYGVQAYPTFIVINPNGQLLYKVNYQQGGPAAYAQALNRGLR